MRTYWFALVLVLSGALLYSARADGQERAIAKNAKGDVKQGEAWAL
jgi:hypothetical protein